LTILTLIGTRPEAIKLAPLIQSMQRQPGRFLVRTCLTGQHRELVDEILPAFGITADDNLDTMMPGQTLGDSTAKILTRLELVFAKYNPDLIIVQGDTTTAFSGALAAFYARIPVAHVEAGLRTGDVNNPFPEEMNRQLISRLATFHFCPTALAANNLSAEGVPERHVYVTGNTGIDAVRLISERIAERTLQPDLPCAIHPTRKLIVVTAHRRENIPYELQSIAQAITRLAQRPDVQIVWPVHPNPDVQAIIHPILARCRRVHLTPPLAYPAFIDVMRRSHLILSDSGGIQEEAPALGKPVLVLRNTTERPEAIEAGANILVGTDSSAIFHAASTLLDDPYKYASMARVRDVYGDGKASNRICATLSRVLKQERKAVSV
jgi:UDP-N-acetylglucosamine 2-epimerase (non-hydrolysing)